MVGSRVSNSVGPNVGDTNGAVAVRSSSIVGSESMTMSGSVSSKVGSRVSHWNLDGFVGSAVGSNVSNLIPTGWRVRVVGRAVL